MEQIVPASVLIRIGIKPCQRMHEALMVMQEADRKGKNTRTNENENSELITQRKKKLNEKYVEFIASER